MNYCSAEYHEVVEVELTWAFVLFIAVSLCLPMPCPAMDTEGLQVHFSKLESLVCPYVKQLLSH